MKYSIVIPTYNHCDDLLKPCLNSIIEHTDVEDLEIIISANGCVDNTKQYLIELKTEFEKVGLNENLKIVWDEAPLGYAKAINAGIKVSTTNKIILLNNDTIILNQIKNTWVNQLNNQFEIDPLCGITGPSEIFSDISKRHFLIFFCVMIDRRVINTIGLLNEEYNIGGYEDIEFCALAQNAGFHLNVCTNQTWCEKSGLFTGDFPIYHIGEGTVHDTTLVANFETEFNLNALKFAKKFNPDWYEDNFKKYSLNDTEQIETSYEQTQSPIENLCWLNNDYPEMFNEIIRDNCYNLEKSKIYDRNVLDIGANIGAFSLLANLYGAKKIIAVEPIKSTVKNLITNTINTNISVLPLAVTNITGDTIAINVNNDDFNNSSYLIKSDNFEQVLTISLSDLLKFYGDNPKLFLKIDCEGAEFDIISGATKEDFDKIDTIIVEVHLNTHPIYKTDEFIVAKLTEFGFVLTKSEQMYSYNLTEDGKPFNMKELPAKVQFWARG